MNGSRSIQISKALWHVDVLRKGLPPPSNGGSAFLVVSRKDTPGVSRADTHE